MREVIDTDYYIDSNGLHPYHGRDDSADMKHWKYIKREKVNGKWVYTYDDPKKDKNGASKVLSNLVNKNNVKKLPDLNKKKPKHSTYSQEGNVQVETIQRDTNKLFSSSKSLEIGDSKTVFKERGVAERLIDNGKAYVDYLKGVSGKSSNKSSEKSLDISNEVKERVKKAIGDDEHHAVQTSKSQVDKTTQAYAQAMIAYANNKATLQDVEKAKKAASDSMDSYNETAKKYNDTLLGKLGPAETYTLGGTQAESEAHRRYMTDDEWYAYQERLMWRR